MKLEELAQASPYQEPTVLYLQRYFRIKRVIDLTLCLLALPFILALVMIIAIIIVLDSPGSPFFIQERIGKDRRPFRLYKFRTMRCDYDDQDDRAFMKAYVAGEVQEDKKGRGDREALFKPIKTHDITRVGQFLRRASLDEVPQVINVFRGEMSLVGPRPNVPWEVDAYLDWHVERLSVLPGITGWAQIHGRSSLSFDEIVTYDLQYIRNLSVRNDWQILWRTFWIVFTGRGAR